MPTIPSDLLPAYHYWMTPGRVTVDKQVIWLTGCASGVGLHLTDAFLARGAQVLATDIDLDGMRHAARARGWDASRLLMRRLDVRDPGAWDALYSELIGAWARLDCLFNVAGVLHPGRLTEASGKDWIGNAATTLDAICGVTWLCGFCSASF